jgi:hypothetical protein
MENVLDPTHTAFTHKTLMRGMNERRQAVAVQLSAHNGALRLEFSGERQQNGLISKLTESNRTGSTTNILRPGIVEVVYRQDSQINLVTTVYFTPVNNDETRGFILLTTRLKCGLAYLKAAIFLPMFHMIIRQDQRILAASHANWKAFGCPENAISPMDYVRPNLEALLGGMPLPAAQTPLNFMLRL